ncbi:hypothetical protein KY340_01585 [Candidatus Woesearchaeota archaeon]|nr:hypothetical protein [Candidatus Woesearchaeota archaeon]
MKLMYVLVLLCALAMLTSCASLLPAEPGSPGGPIGQAGEYAEAYAFTNDLVLTTPKDVELAAGESATVRYTVAGRYIWHLGYWYDVETSSWKPIDLSGDAYQENNNWIAGNAEGIFSFSPKQSGKLWYIAYYCNPGSVPRTFDCNGYKWVLDDINVKMVEVFPEEPGAPATEIVESTEPVDETIPETGTETTIAPATGIVSTAPAETITAATEYELLDLVSGEVYLNSVFEIGDPTDPFDLGVVPKPEEGCVGSTEADCSGTCTHGLECVWKTYDYVDSIICAGEHPEDADGTEQQAGPAGSFAEPFDLGIREKGCQTTGELCGGTCPHGYPCKWIVKKVTVGRCEGNH